MKTHDSQELLHQIAVFDTFHSLTHGFRQRTDSNATAVKTAQSMIKELLKELHIDVSWGEHPSLPGQQ